VRPLLFSIRCAPALVPPSACAGPKLLLEHPELRPNAGGRWRSRDSGLRCERGQRQDAHSHALRICSSRGRNAPYAPAAHTAPPGRHPRAPAPCRPPCPRAFPFPRALHLLTGQCAGQDGLTTQRASGVNRARTNRKHAKGARPPVQAVPQLQGSCLDEIVCRASLPR
jgi:hypothetical protein